MSTQVILTSPVEKLGDAGQTVNVADGYARNFLFPRNLALPATAGNQKRYAAQLKKREAVAAAAKAGALELVEKLTKQSFTIQAAVGEGDKLHGAITAADIAAALQKEGLAVDRKQIALEHPLHTAGVFDVDVKLHPEVSTKVKIFIEGGGEPPAPAEPKKAVRKK
jgi:large subunit ribosomal protein L9